MTRYLNLLCLTIGASLAAASLPQSAAAQTVTLEPGLYQSSSVMTMAGRAMPADNYEDCIREGENSKTLEELLGGMSADGQCTLSNASMTSSTGSVDYVCKQQGMGFEAKGSMVAEYGSDFYIVTANGTFGPMGTVNVKTTMRRSGACPADWVAPDDGYDDEEWDE